MKQRRCWSLCTGAGLCGTVHQVGEGACSGGRLQVARGCWALHPGVVWCRPQQVAQHSQHMLAACMTARHAHVHTPEKDSAWLRQDNDIAPVCRCIFGVCRQRFLCHAAAVCIIIVCFFHTTWSACFLQMAIVLEFMDGGTLADVLKKVGHAACWGLRSAASPCLHGLFGLLCQK